MSSVLKATTENKTTSVTTHFKKLATGTTCLSSQLLSKVTVTSCSFYIKRSCVHLAACPLPSSRHHRSNGDCVDGKRENYQVCCVQQLCTVQCTHIWTDLTVLWIGFCLTGPISLCFDSFEYCISLYIVRMRRFVTRWGGAGGIEASLRTTTSFSASTLLVESFDP